MATVAWVKISVFIDLTSRIRVPTVRIPDAGLPSLTFKQYII
jgi:hypothetical protein